MTQHPNTVAAGFAGGFGTLAVYLLNKYAGTHLTATDAAAIATASASAVLFVGRRGIRGMFAGIWNGSKPAKK